MEQKYRNHELSGNFKGCHECHIEPDWLLIDEVMDDVLVLMPYRVGSHSTLFKKNSFIVDKLKKNLTSKSLHRVSYEGFLVP